MHALVIEDDPITAMMIADELRDLGYETIDSASTQAEAISAVARKCPDLVTCDGTLRIANGVAAAHAIRRSFPVPIVFITGDPERAKAALPDASVLGKPFSIAAFQNAISAAQRRGINAAT